MSLSFDPNEGLVDEGEKKMAIILPVAKYKQLLEDLHDLAVVAARRQEEPVDLQEMKRRLKAHGLLEQFNPNSQIEGRCSPPSR
jgi:hypothetical protein